MSDPSHVLVCCDFDGTIALQDTGVILIDHCMGTERRKQLDESVMRGELSLRKAFKEMWAAVDLSYEEALELFRDVELDPVFKAFATYCFKEKCPTGYRFWVRITKLAFDLHNLSFWLSGPKFLLEYFFKRFFPDDYTKFRIEANYGENIGRKWEFSFHDESEYGHNKGVTMKQIQDEYAAANNGAKPYTVFCGDGVSDLSAARHADLLFVRRGRGLEGYCQTHKIPFTGFDDFQVILAEVQKLKGSN
ncbi:hypothetical protein DSO57_1019843 [Entomophthora muscae]|uniref:Uncharacterized protein n=1 Tax=Entomophthora muscae TaxID=34485 RepID=A0ACC2TQZ6_9FUNG|nr:hypothetical protein DSO57_1019843 [Entomophthora muscae]